MINLLAAVQFMLFVVITLSTDYDIQVWTRPGQYYGHLCQFQFNVISQYISPKHVGFYLSPIKNFIFWDKSTYSYTNTQDIQYKFYQNIDIYDPCKKLQTSLYRCVILEKMVYPRIIPRRRLYNATHYSLQFRLQNVVCPASHQSNQIQMSIVIENQTLRRTENLSLTLTNLSYYGAQAIQFHKPKNYLLNTQRSYQFSFSIYNETLQRYWKQAELIIKDNTLIKLYSCSPDCQVTQDKIIFANPNFDSSSKKQFSYMGYPIQISTSQTHSFQINFEFISVGSLNLEIAVTSQYSSFLQNPKNGSIPDSYKNGYLGFAKDVIFGLSQEQYYNIPSSERNDPQNDPSSSSSSSSSSTNLSIYLIRLVSSSYFSVLFILLLIIIGISIFFIRKVVFWWECYIYITWFFLAISARGLMLFFEIKQVKLLIIFFIVAQLLQNGMYFFHYFCVFWFSKKMIRKLQDSSICLQFLKLLINYRFYGVMLAIFQLQSENRVFKNTYIYKVHIIHLLISCAFIIAELTFLAVSFAGRLNILRLLYVVVIVIMYALMVSFIKTMISFDSKDPKKSQKQQQGPQTAKNIVDQ